MLKNHDGVIKAAEGDAKPKVYVPMRYSSSYQAASMFGGISTTPSSCELPLLQGTLEKYFES